MISEEKYLVTCNGKKYEYRLTLEKSGAFAYGNGTCMAMYVDDNFIDIFDTRYSDFDGTAEQFHDWSLECLKSYCRKDCTIERA